MERVSWFKPPEKVKHYVALKNPVLTQPDMAVNIKKMLELNRGSSITDKAMGFYDVIGQEMPDLYMMDTPERLKALTQFRKDYVTLRDDYNSKVEEYNARKHADKLAEIANANKVNISPDQSTKTT